jgi:hypothetical protein
MALKWVVREMEDRYRSDVRSLGVRNIDGYNGRASPRPLAKGLALTRTVQTGFDDESPASRSSRPRSYDRRRAAALYRRRSSTRWPT